MTQRIVVLNPNSTVAVTEGISQAVEPLRLAAGPRIDALTLEEGPPGIESQGDVDGIVVPLLARLQREPAAAYVIACFSDPGLAAARDSLTAPVFGIAESAMTAAMTLGERFGIVAILPTSVPRHRRYVRTLGLSSRFADSMPVGLGVTELSDAEATLERMCAVGRRLRDERGADVLIMGCAGMAGYRGALAQATGLPVVEPCQAATAAALGAVLLGP